MLQILKMKSEIIKRWIIVILASAIIGISVSLFILSFEIYNDGYGTDISFNLDMIIFFICGVAILVYGIYSIYAYKKHLSMLFAYYASFSVITVLLTFYPLGVFFKALAKGKSFVEYQEYLYLGVFGFIILIYLIFSYLCDLRKNA